jgi:2-dehydropantoate 2-reductase
MEKIGLSAISSVVLFNAVYLEPSHVTLTMKGGFILEKNEKYEKKISSICRSLKKAGFDVKLEKNINGLLWSKLILNLQNAITALTGQSIRESLINNISRKMIISTMKEGIDIVKKSGIKLEALPGVDPKLILLVLSFLGPLAMPIGKFLFKIREDARSSMWQSLARGRPTEIEYINGEIVRLAEKNGLKSPINAKLVQLVKSAERGNKKSFEPRELRRILGI